MFKSQNNIYLSRVLLINIKYRVLGNILRNKFYIVSYKIILLYIIEKRES